MRYFGRNVHGDGLPSPVVTILAATVPAKMNIPTVALVTTATTAKYKVTFTKPGTGGNNVVITRYEIVLESKAKTYHASADCDGT
jgi:hypothetical protein